MRCRAPGWAVRGQCAWALAALLAASSGALGAVPSDAETLFNTGEYAACIDACATALAPAAGAATPDAAWYALKARAELATGRYADAARTTQAGLERHNTHMPLWLLRDDALKYTNDLETEKDLVAKIGELIKSEPMLFFEPENRVAAGQFLLRQGTDARVVLQTWFDRARRDAPASVSPLLAIGELALQKNDPGVAAEAYQAAQKIAPANPDVYYGLARANDDDPEAVSAAVTRALALNPRHVPTLLLAVDTLIDKEQYAQAEELLAKVTAVNPAEPRAWAYRAVIAHLGGDPAKETAARDKALSTWKANPEVDHLIGLKLSQHYRFEVGAAYQQRALAMDGAYAPARFQLCQDLLRTGQEEEGWKLAAAVFKEDPYNIMAFNLVTLHDHLIQFKTVESNHFVLHMDPREAPIYGTRALALLEKAQENFCAKYNVVLPRRTTVEIFPLQQDFEIRTFGFPGEEGFLGVCFGPVVTVNSPASRIAHPTSWEAILWHEFCHTVTLTKTHNKMPRWISEGISVYEERLANPTWGEQMIPEYREIILKDGPTKVSELTSAFMKPPSPIHLSFAYYEASMVVEYIVGRFGTAAIQGILTDLGNDILINEAIARHTEPMEKLDADFAAWLGEKAKAYGAGVDFEEPKLAPTAGAPEFAGWNRVHPNSFWGLIFEGSALMQEARWQDAKAPLEKAQALFPAYAKPDGPYLLLAKAHRELGEENQERAVLEKYLAINGDAFDPRLRVMELAARQNDWKAVQAEALRALGVNPLVAGPYRHLAEADEALGDRPGAIAARRTLLLMDPLDKPEQHYRLARLLYQTRQFAEARREVLMTLEDAPRYRAALDLLTRIADEMKPAETAASAPAAPQTEGGQ